MYYTLTNTTLSFILEGSEQVLALRAKVRVSKEDIVDVQWYDAFSQWSGIMVRMPGSYLPRWVMAGSYWTEDGWDFVFAKKPQGKLTQPILHKVLVVTTDKPRYKRLVIETSKSNFKEIETWWREG